MKQIYRLLSASFILTFLLFSSTNTLKLGGNFEIKAQVTCQDMGGICIPNGEEAACAQKGSGTCPNYRFCCIKFTNVGSGPTVGCPSDSINTAFGCISVGSQQGLTITLLRIGIGLGGGFAFLLMVYAGFMIMTSSGDPKRLTAGKELLTAAISGLLLMVLGTYFLRLVGADILGVFGGG